MYQKIIAEKLAGMNRTDIDPRHVEAWMRSEHGTLDALTRAAFRADVEICVACIDEAGAEQSERLAGSMGIR